MIRMATAVLCSTTTDSMTLLLPQVSIKFKAVSEPQPNGKVDVFFEVNGVPRVVEVAVSAKAAAASGSACC